MTDQTKWGIPEVQSRNKDRLYLATSLEVKTNKLNKLKEIYTSTSQLDNISEELKKQFDDTKYNILFTSSYKFIGLVISFQSVNLVDI